MHFREGADVVSADGTKLGVVDRLVIDPSTREITHVVISQGFLFHEHRVVPTAIVATAEAEQITLEPAIELDELPPFEETHYVSLVTEGDPGADGAAGQAEVAWRFPTYAAAAAPKDPPYPWYPPGQVEMTERNVPDGSLVVEAGSTVVTADGEEIGRVREVETDADGAMIAVVIDPGWFTDEQRIPAHFVGAVEEDRVVLAVTGATVRQLQPS